jgi:hypothetical protein
MTLFLCWVAAPIVLGLVATGCGLAAQCVGGFRLPQALVPPLGLAVVIVATDLVTLSNATAQLAAPLVVGLAAAGYGLSLPWRLRSIDGWAASCAVVVFVVYALPIVLSGEPTFAGYITLDDTSTWLALTDRIMEHGQTLSGLAPSTYQQVLADDLGGGYPVGAFLALGVGAKLTGQDLAWLFQPTIAVLAAMLGLGIYAASEGLLSSRRLRALVAALGAQPALLFAYALWSGIKEVTAAALVALISGLVVSTMGRWASVRGVVPIAVATAALFAVLSLAGAIWLVLPTIVVAVALGRRGFVWSLRAGAALLAATAILSLPSIAVAQKFLSGVAGGEITTRNEVSNLGHPLDTLQLFGIWPATDFRWRPHDPQVAYVCIAALIGAAVLALLVASRRRAWSFPFYFATGAGGALLALLLEHVGLSSPWLNAKAMAAGSPALVAAGIGGAAAAFERGRRTEAVVAAAAIAAGVLWSNGLAYSNAWLAPRSQLSELETIGRRFAGDGPALMTEFQPYGARHFLRHLDAEAASERRRRLIPLQSGHALQSGQTADLDAFDLQGIVPYQTLVLRRSPVESRPPSIYQLVWRGRWYEVWQRPEQVRPILEHLSLGNPFAAAVVPACEDVLRLARAADADGGLIAAVPRPDKPIVVDLTAGSYPPRWQTGVDEPGTLVPHGGGSVTLSVAVARDGTYTLWLGGSFRRTVTAVVDGHDVGSTTDQLNNAGQWTALVTAHLARGSHRIVIDYGGSRIAPGAGGDPFAMGPLILATTTADVPVRFLSPAAARTLCGRRLDWVEALGR